MHHLGDNMRKVVGKKFGRPDFTVQSFISTTPTMGRTQARYLSAAIFRDVSMVMDENGVYEDVVVTTLPISLRGKSLYIMWFGLSLSVNRRVEIHVGKIDLDKYIEAAFFGVPWTKNDILVEDWGKAGSWGVVTINRGINVPAVLNFEENAPACKYIPQYTKYTVGIYFDLYGNPGENITCDIGYWNSGMTSSYPWWY